MSISEVVDAEYRLQPADLAGRPSRLIIANVSYQGVEQLAPVLHFRSMTKRLVLSPDLVRQLVNLTGTPIFSNWIGVAIVVEADHMDGGHMIGIMAADNSPFAHHADMIDAGDASSRWLALVTVGAIALLGLLFVLSSLPQLESLLSRAP